MPVTLNALRDRTASVAVVGLGYVGLPLAVAFAESFKVIAFDINEKRIEALKKGHDATNEVCAEALRACTARFTCDSRELREASVLIVTVPTPIDAHRNPDLTPVISASETVGRNLAPGSVVVYESTVYPGVTEDICIPLLEKHSGLICGRDFSVGYSPERINPGDKTHTLRTVAKVVSGSDAPTLELLAGLYGAVVRAGIHKASSIKVAEAAKVIENTQRDLNIALINELSIIFDHLGIDTLEVLEAAGTKWNFLPFRPGLVGGHCIGVDPYYLTYKAEELGYHPQVILAGRRINDHMGKYVAETCVKQLIRRGRLVSGARVGILGFTFKENVPDLRNTRVIDIMRELEEYGVTALAHDPRADAEEARREYGIRLSELGELRDLDAVILAVAHEEYKALSPTELRTWFAAPDKGVLLDLKGFFSPLAVAGEGLTLWRL